MLSGAEQARVEAAITQAEASTSGEIYCVVATHRLRFPETAIFFAAVLGLALPFLAALAGYPAWATGGDAWTTGPAPVFKAVEAILIAQLGTMLLLGALIWAIGLDRLLTPGLVIHRRLHAMAATQFLAHGLTETRERTGVLIFASPLDRYAEVIADEGIYAKVSPVHWRTTVDALTAAALGGDLVGGFERAIALAGAVLAEHFPIRDDDTNEIPNRIVEI